MCRTFNKVVDFRNGGSVTAAPKKKRTHSKSPRPHRAKSVHHTLTREQSKLNAREAWDKDSLSASIEKHCERLLREGKVHGVVTCIMDARSYIAK